MAPNNATTSKTSDKDKGKKEEEKKTEEVDGQKKGVSAFAALEEDDEFEEFEVQDWDDGSTGLGNLNGVQPGNAKSGGDRLWEDNWDDDDVEEEFNLQLRKELAKDSNKDAMQH